ncbi:MAG: NB-ARC domain-containing protein, partial [Eubacteriales bacterium]
MARVALKCGDRIVIDNLEYIIDSVVGDGATCIVYSARYTDHAGLSHSILLKECYPYADNIIRDGNILSWAIENERQKSLSSFKTAYEKLMTMQNIAKLRNSTSHAFDFFEANGTLYSVTDITEGTTFDKDKSRSLADILKTVLALSKVVQKYHNNGYLHLDIKPGNFLVIPETRELVVLFDLDSVTSIEDIKSGKVKCVPYSKGWAAPEQMQGHINKLCPATDIYSIGAVLFQKLFERDITPADTGLFADWDFDGEIFDNVNPKIKRFLRTIFRKTLSANIKRRYQNADELITALEEAVKAAEQKTYLLSDYIVSDINFVGRKADLLKLDELFDNGTKAVFLHGFGGVGKTALATKYAELYGNKYDCVKFCRYSNGLKQIIDSLEISNESNDNNDEHRKLLKSVLKDSKTLIIVDNFDVEDDEELEYLLSLNFNVLFTTRNDYSQYISSKKLEIIELESLPTDALIQVFKNEYGRDITDHEEELVQDIIEKFGNLTIIVPMIAKQILSSHISIEEFASSIEDDVFARFNEDNEDIRIRKDGKSRKTNSLDYLRAMFNITALSDEHKTVLQYLYLLRYHNDLALTTKKYRQYTGDNNLNVLNDLAFKNWVTIEHDEFKDEDNITVHQLIYDLVEKDFYPSYESVPGITKYIESCFKVLEDMMIPDQSISEAVINWESAKCITF